MSCLLTAHAWVSWNMSLTLTISFILHSGIWMAWSQIPDSNITERFQPPCSNSASIYKFPRCFPNTSHPDALRHHSRVRNPKNIPSQALPVVSDHIHLVNYQPDFSIIVSVHNQASVIGRNIAAILNLTQGIWQLVVVLDGCVDDSLGSVREVTKKHVSQYEEIYQRILSDKKTDQNVQQVWECEVKRAIARSLNHRQSDELFLHDTASAHLSGVEEPLTNLSSLLTEVILIVQPSSVWETTSDNLGMAYATASRYFILVQADMMVADPGWNLIMSRPTEMFADIFSVTARCAHSFEGSETPEADGSCLKGMAEIPSSRLVEEYTNRIYIRGTVNRGPLLLRADRMIALGLFDEQNFLICSDDHDLMARALIEYNWRAAGYFAVRVIMPFNDGSTHKRPSMLARFFSEVSASDRKYEHERRHRVNESANAERQRAAVLLTRSEIRHISNEDIDHVTEFWHQRLSYTLCCEPSQ